MPSQIQTRKEKLQISANTLRTTSSISSVVRGDIMIFTKVSYTVAACEADLIKLACRNAGMFNGTY
jgi:hypothetical protein